MNLTPDLVEQLKEMCPSPLGYEYDFYDVDVPEKLGGEEGDIVTFKKRSWETSNGMFRYEWEFFQSSSGAHPASDEEVQKYKAWKADQAVKKLFKNVLKKGKE